MDNNMLDIIKELKINPLSELKEPPTYCTVNSRPSLTAGNFSLIYGKKKAGKTFLLGALLASTVNNSLQLNSIQGSLPPDKSVVLYFDTEQSQFHANRSIKRICKLVGNPDPSNLFAYALRSLPPEDRLSVIEHLILTTPNVGFVAIDGIRDLLTMGINDEQEATKLTSLFLKWSYNYNIHIVLLLHQNKNDLNARGHIGTEVVNKAETIISVTKEGKSNIFKVACEDSRDIPFDDFGFTISDDGMPIPCDLPTAKTRKVKDPNLIASEKHLEVLHSLFKGEVEYTYEELRTILSQEFDMGRDASEKFITYYKDKNWITKDRRGKCVYHKLDVNASSFYYHPN